MLSTDFPYFHKDCPISVTTHNGTCIGVDFRDVFLVHLLPRDGHSFAKVVKIIHPPSFWRIFLYLFLHGVSTERAFCWRSFWGDKSAVPWQLGVLRECPSLGRRWTSLVCSALVGGDAARHVSTLDLLALFEAQ